jgi:hypothetical protein
MFSLLSCLDKKNELSVIIGTWELQTGMVIHNNNNNTVVKYYTQGQRFIKVINKSHFSFLRHDFNKGKDLSNVFVAVGGTYSLEGKTYKEYFRTLHRQKQGRKGIFVPSTNN